MEALRLACFVATLTATSAEPGSGLAHNENFVVSAPSQDLAEEILQKAEGLRKQIALDWLGEELPPSVGPASIHVTISDASDRGHTWPIDDPNRRYHLIWLTTTREKALTTALAHEIVHAVLATEFSGGIATWAEEGAACLQDDPDRLARRRRTIDWMAKTGNWSDLQRVLEAQAIVATDHATYSVAASLTQFLLERGDKAKFLSFCRQGKSAGWDAALSRCYGIRSVRELQAAWQAWTTAAARKSPVSSATAPQPTTGS